MLANTGFAAPRVLEVASGTGQHAAYLAAGLPDMALQPTELTAEQLPRCGFVEYAPERDTSIIVTVNVLAAVPAPRRSLT